MKCNICGSDYADNYFKDEYSDEIICEECLLEIDGITTSTETHYLLDGQYMASDFNNSELLENICDNTAYKKIKEGD